LAQEHSARCVPCGIPASNVVKPVRWPARPDDVVTYNELGSLMPRLVRPAVPTLWLLVVSTVGGSGGSIASVWATSWDRPSGAVGALGAAAALLPAPANGADPGAASLPQRLRGALRDELKALRGDLRKAWDQWREAVVAVGPRIDRLNLEAGRVRLALDSAERLRSPDVAGVCGALGTCAACSSSPICGWCAASTRCVPGTRTGPAEEASCILPTTYSFEGCPGVACETLLSCSTCTSNPLCGWCGTAARCAEGTEWGPFRGASMQLPVPYCQVPEPAPCPEFGQVPPSVPPGGWVHRDSLTVQCGEGP